MHTNGSDGPTLTAHVKIKRPPTQSNDSQWKKMLSAAAAAAAARIRVRVPPVEEDVRLCLQMRESDIKGWRRFDPEDHMCSWWYVDVVKNGDYSNVAVAAKEIKDLSCYVHERSGSASANSALYRIGGEQFLDWEDALVVSDLWYTSKFVGDDDYIYPTGWFKGTPMKHPRCGTCSVVIHQEIYVFGGLEETFDFDYNKVYNADTWAEFYNIDTESWSSLPPPPGLLFEDNLYVNKCAAMDFDYAVNEKLILVNFSTGPLYSYDVIHKTWELLDPNFGASQSRYLINFKFVVVTCRRSFGSPYPVLMLIKDDGLLHGYHLRKKEWFKCYVLGLEGENVFPLFEDLPYVHFVPLGRNHEKLCLVWTYTPPMEKYTMYVRCTKLSFYEVVPGGSIAAKVESTNLFHLNDAGPFMYCSPLVMRPRRKRAGESLEEEEKNKH